MHSKENWDDLRYVLAVADGGSVSAAARALGVNHATVLRRIAAFESHHGALIFDKTSRGYAITDDGRRVVDAVREVEASVQSVSRIVAGATALPRGVVRVTSTDSLSVLVLPGIVTKLQSMAGELQIDLMSSNVHLDLSRLDADITVRPSLSLPDELCGQSPSKLGFGVYAMTGAPENRWLIPSGASARSRAAEWLSTAYPDASIAGRADSFLTLRELASEGLGQAILPCWVGDEDRRLNRRSDPIAALETNIWVANHADLATVPRLRVVRELLSEALSEQEGRLSGRG